MSEKVFYFAVKPGCEPVQLASLSAHDRLPWVARGYDFREMYALVDGDHVTLWPDTLDDITEEALDFIAGTTLDCVAKSVAKLTSCSWEPLT